MAWAIVTKKQPKELLHQLVMLRRARRQLSPLTLRIMAVNALALAIMVASILYLARYQDRLIEVEIETLQAETKIFATALAESATISIDDKDERLVPPLARQMIRRLDEVTEARARLYELDGRLVADSWMLGGVTPKRVDSVIIEQLPSEESWLMRHGQKLLAALLPGRTDAPLYIEDNPFDPVERDEVLTAMGGETGIKIWRRDTGAYMFSVAVPVQRYKTVLGVLNLTRDATRMADAIKNVRADILKLFIGALAITAILSLYLARAIANPITQLARAADAVRYGQGSGQGGVAYEIPDFSARGDEIGDLSRSLRAMTTTLMQRMIAIESFAADVAHEIKNPLASVQSAVETLTRIKDNPTMQPQREKLLGIIHHDVKRLDRLITDISSASRLDAELSRTALSRVDVGQLLQTMQSIYQNMDMVNAPLSPVVVDTIAPSLVVMGFEGRLSQVLQNLIDNAISFSPMPAEDGRGTVRLKAVRDGALAKITVEDDGPGIPENKLDAIFDRFYSERPAAEAFGGHSGLGLSICKQIIEAHKGHIVAANRKDLHGNVIGAVFTVTLPLVDGRA